MMKQLSISLLVLLTLACNQSNINAMEKQERYIPVSENLKIWTETYGKAENTSCLFINGAGANSSS